MTCYIFLLRFWWILQSLLYEIITGLRMVEHGSASSSSAPCITDGNSKNLSDLCSLQACFSWERWWGALKLVCCYKLSSQPLTCSKIWGNLTLTRSTHMIIFTNHEHEDLLMAQKLVSDPHIIVMDCHKSILNWIHSFHSFLSNSFIKRSLEPVIKLSKEDCHAQPITNLFWQRTVHTIIFHLLPSSYILWLEFQVR